MKTTHSILNMITIIFLFAGLSIASYATEPENLGALREKLIQYHDSGEYEQDQKLAIKQATDYLKQRLADRKNNPSIKPFAIVFDIDETLLTGYPYLLKERFGGTLEQLGKLEGKGQNPVIKPSLEFYQFAKANYIAVFLISGRNPKYRAATIRNLNNVGYKDWRELFIKPVNYNSDMYGPYKTYIRKKIEKLGYEIILNISDQQSDLIGGHADKTIKLPNPYYLVD